MVHESLGARLRRSLLALRGPAIDRRPLLAPEVFLRDYYATGTPLVITDLVTRWPAFTLLDPRAPARALRRRRDRDRGRTRR
jgi:hypothetical protein